MTSTKPRVAGYWAAQVTPQLDLVKFGENGDTVRPFKSPGRALSELRFLSQREPDCRYYLLRMFDNGQMKTFEFDVEQQIVPK